jgi:hypothetical protein
MCPGVEGSESRSRATVARIRCDKVRPASPTLIPHVGDRVSLALNQIDASVAGGRPVDWRS